NERAEGIALVQGLRHAGLDPARVVRLDSADENVQAWTVTTSAPVGYTARPVEPLDTTAVPSWPGTSGRPADSIVPDVLTDPHAVVAASTSPDGVTLDPVSAHRVYSVWDVDGRRWYVSVLDGDRQVVGYLSALW